MQKGPTTPKGFRDINPELAKKRRATMNMIADVLEGFDFVPLETPTVEFAETLTGKYGDEEKLIYKFTDRGGRELALRYDLTVPLARYIANNLNVIANGPFRRYQTGNVFRGENTQKGRYREFTQFDMDTIGSTEKREDAKVIAAAIKAARKIGLTDAKMAVNDRKNFKDLKIEDIREIDKMYKIGKENIRKDLLEFVEQTTLTDNLKNIFDILEKEFELKEGKDFFFDPTLARGLDYYTSTILELKPNGRPEEQSIGGGGRYDELIGMFAERKIPAVGFSFGIDRIMELI
ncbi:MAG TPA: HisS family protein [Patescibacteria group bacterium]|nr:HisS family protein [Patescibacteria group bacterium]